MNCPQCGAAVELNSKFCTSCGMKILPTSESAAAMEGAQGRPPAQPQQQMMYQQPPNPMNGQQMPPGGHPNYVPQPKPPGKFATEMNNYFTFAWGSLKSPKTFSEKVDGSKYLFGIITLAAMAVLIPLFNYLGFLISSRSTMNRSLRDLNDIFGSEVFGGGLFSSTPSFATFFLRPLLLDAIVLAAAVTAIFLVAQLMKSSISYVDALARFGSFVIAPAALLLVAAILSPLGGFSNFLYTIGLLGVVLAMAGTINSFKSSEEGKMDFFYIVGIAVAATYFIQYILNSL